MVMVHEWGHFSVARRFNVAISTFSIGFGPTLVKKVSSQAQIEYRLCAILLGGYVKFAEDLNNHPGQQLFENLRLWKKILILLAGPFANLLLAFFALIIYFKMDSYTMLPYIGAVQEHSIAQQIGFKEGQRIQKVNGTPVFSWTEVIQSIHSNPTPDFTVFDSLQGLQIIHLSTKVLKSSSNLFDVLGFKPHLPQIPPIISKVQSGSPAEKAGFKTGDKIIATNHFSIQYMYQLSDWISTHPDKLVEITFLRDGIEHQVKVELGHWANGSKHMGQLGILTFDFSHYPDWFHYVHRSWFQAFYQSLMSIWGFCKIQLGVWFHLKEQLSNLSGPIGMAKAADHAWSIGFKTYLFFIIWINIGLAIVNLLPIPILDGGQCVLLILNKIFPKFLGRESQNIIMLWSIIFIGGLFILGLFNDLSL
jgi:regulator of sigma E protease